jgi:hypothetical protein
MPPEYVFAKAFYKLEHDTIVKERIICNYQNNIGRYFYTKKPLYFNKSLCTAVSALEWYRVLRKTIIYNKIDEIHLL